jgi:hypothetical protein
MSVFIIGVAVAMFIAQIVRPRDLFRWSGVAYIGIVTAVAAMHGWRTWRQYAAWSGNEFGQLFLPPHQSASYFLGYAWTNIWLPFTLTLGVSVGLLVLVWVANTVFRRRFFHIEEYWLAASGAFVVGYANIVLYGAVLLGTLAVVAIVRTALRRPLDRHSLARLWLPIAIAVAIYAL